MEIHRSSRGIPRGTLVLAVLSVACVIVPFMVWRETWFGRSLSPDELGRYLRDSARPRRIQHALSVIADGIMKGDTTVRQWYPDVAVLAGHPATPIRTTAAWVMGQDNTSELFHRGLLKLLEDPELMVRRNAALALVRFGDASGREEIVQMLRPHTVRARRPGKVSHELTLGQEVGTATLLAHVRTEAGEDVEVRSPLPGRVAQVLAPNGAVLQTGAPLVSIAPEATQVWEALRGLYLVGCSEDLPDVERYESGVSDMPDQIGSQAVLTAQAIRTRSEQIPSR